MVAPHDARRVNLDADASLAGRVSRPVCHPGRDDGKGVARSMGKTSCNPTLASALAGADSWSGRLCQSRAPIRRRIGPQGTMVLALVLLACLTHAAKAQSPPSVVVNREYTIKAAFLYHFLTYTEWPDSRAGVEAPLIIAVYGPDPFGAVLDKIAATKTVGNRPIEVRRIVDPADAKPCHLLFVPGTVAHEELGAVFAAVRGLPVLLVGEADGFVDRGGAAEFYVEGNRVRFAFNTDVVDERELKVSSKLLSLAKIVTSKQASK